MGIDKSPGGGVGGVLGVSVQSPDKWYDKGVMCPTVTQLMPPILSNDSLLLDLVLLPSVLVLVVEEDGLENMVLERLGLIELILEC
jgi:hypothetical protein